jgi:hypothetical protein
MTRRKRGISLIVEGKVEVPKIDKPETKGDLKISVCDVDKSKGDIRSSLRKGKGDIEANVYIITIFKGAKRPIKQAEKITSITAGCSSHHYNLLCELHLK